MKIKIKELSFKQLKMSLFGSTQLKQERDYLQNELKRVQKERDFYQLKVQHINHEFNKFLQKENIEGADETRSEHSLEGVEAIMQSEDPLEKWDYIKLYFDDQKWGIIKQIDTLKEISKEADKQINKSAIIEKYLFEKYMEIQDQIEIAPLFIRAEREEFSINTQQIDTQDQYEILTNLFNE